MTRSGSASSATGCTRSCSPPSQPADTESGASPAAQTQGGPPMAPPETHDLLIDGRRVPALSGRTFTVTNPATGEPVATIAEAGDEDVDRAAAASRRAFEEGAWARLSAAERGQILYRMAERIRARRAQLRRRGQQMVRRDHPRGRPGRGLHPARTHWRRRADRPLELPPDDRVLEGRPGAGDGERGHPQAGQRHTADRLAFGRDRARGGRTPRRAP